jgi:hypothetical protein
VAVDVSTLTLGTPTTGILGSGQDAYYRFTVNAGETVRVSLSTDTPGSVNDLFVRYGQVPTIGQFDVTSDTPLISNPDTVIAATQLGTYYVLVHGNSVPGTEHYTLQATPLQFSVGAITPDHASNLGSVTLTIDGAKFNANEHLEVVASDGTIRDAMQVQWVDSAKLSG